jgi:hypothetical protein
LVDILQPTFWPVLETNFRITGTFQNNLDSVLIAGTSFQKKISGMISQFVRDFTSSKQELYYGFSSQKDSKKL